MSGFFKISIFVSTTLESQGDTHEVQRRRSGRAAFRKSASVVVLPFQTFIRNFYILQLSAWSILTKLGKVYKLFITACI